MESKLEHFLNIIHMDKTIQEKFRNILVKKVVVSKKNDYIAIFLSTNEMITLNNYLELKTRALEFFNSNILINIENLGVNDEIKLIMDGGHALCKIMEVCHEQKE